MSAYALSIDYGTSNTVAVLRWPDGKTRPLLFDGSPLLPSAVYAMPEGHLATGRDAVHSARLDPTRFEPNPKRHVDELDLLLGGASVPLTEIVAATLARVAQEARNVAGDGVGELVMTHPAEWGSARRQVLLDAARAAGLPAPRMVPEPVAAGTYFTRVLGHGVAEGGCVVVYDLGAGTFDASVVRRAAGGFETLAYRGLDDIGGVDVDDLVVQLIGAVVAPDAPLEWGRLLAPQTLADRRAARQLRDDARMLKERLSRESSAAIIVPIVDRDLHVTRGELEAKALHLVAQTVAVTTATIKAARTPRDAIAGLFLVGGSTRMPLVATELHRATAIAPTVLDQPELVVAEGALLADAAPAAPVPAPTSPMPTTPAPTTPIPISPISPAPVSPGTGPIAAPGSPGSPYPVSAIPTAPVSPVAPMSPMATPQPAPVSPVLERPATAGPAWHDVSHRKPAEFLTTRGSMATRTALRLLFGALFFAAGGLGGGLVFAVTDSEAAPWFLAGPIWGYGAAYVLVTIGRLATMGGQATAMLLDDSGVTVDVGGRPHRLEWSRVDKAEVHRRGVDLRQTLLVRLRPGTSVADEPFWQARRLADGRVRIADLASLNARRAPVLAAASQYSSV
ncbi:Hsp70 family protein [Dactylosporangium sp. NPDC000244]|uniref:Hsp70 family protein n=1 Tax=Dactylosporangium sp. NPDC000244 TaxID=3154365 RepID=UPI00331AC66B